MRVERFRVCLWSPLRRKKVTPLCPKYSLVDPALLSTSLVIFTTTAMAFEGRAVSCCRQRGIPISCHSACLSGGDENTRMGAGNQASFRVHVQLLLFSPFFPLRILLTCMMKTKQNSIYTPLQAGAKHSQSYYTPHKNISESGLGFAQWRLDKIVLQQLRQGCRAENNWRSSHSRSVPANGVTKMTHNNLLDPSHSVRTSTIHVLLNIICSSDSSDQHNPPHHIYLSQLPNASCAEGCRPTKPYNKTARTAERLIPNDEVALPGGHEAWPPHPPMPSSSSMPFRCSPLPRHCCFACRCCSHHPSWPSMTAPQFSPLLPLDFLQVFHAP